ncbi:protein kinase [Streptomyces sp. JJ66]|uniref:aminoglycoside phosphotransferase family protein n=1 Tax=Streptomyces sp. JJ66 TaxID=2803843 RepID=UPI001C592779|nr:aminoglycoside phosphotransferase family protein [Streptomyces sp. JJ66]MBW1601425.1 protein kinase [Streptomyces sp. JJ66]
MVRALPGKDFWRLIHPYTGDLSSAEPTVRGFGSDFTAVVGCEKGPLFVKAMRNRQGGRRDSLLREKVINSAVWPLSPALSWSAEDESWIVLGFTVVDGRRADLSPDTADLPYVVQLIDRIGSVPLPGFAHGWHEQRWDRFAETPAAARLFRGDALIHGDINPSNLIIGDAESWVVDWAWPTRGAGFIDPACLVVQLVAAGHTPESAEQWAAQCPAWQEADPKGMDAFAAATVRMWCMVVERKPEAEWCAAMRDAARAWAAHRSVRVN